MISYSFLWYKLILLASNVPRIKFLFLLGLFACNKCVAFTRVYACVCADISQSTTGHSLFSANSFQPWMIHHLFFSFLTTDSSALLLLLLSMRILPVSCGINSLSRVCMRTHVCVYWVYFLGNEGYSPIPALTAAILDPFIFPIPHYFAGVGGTVRIFLNSFPLHPLPYY